MDSAGLLRMDEYIESSAEDVHSVLVIRHGTLVFEAYFYPFRSSGKHMLASCTKSFTATLMGIAIDKGAIKGVDQSMLDFFPEYRGADLEGKRAIRLSHLLSMTSGLDWPSKGPDDATKKMNVSPDWVGFVLGRPIARPPGEEWNYNNGTSHMLSAIIQKATGETTVQFAAENLFVPLGISDMVWESNGQGTTVGCAGLYLRPRDMAKLGELYLRNGEWNGRRIVSAAWVKESWTPHSAKDYGYQWWITPELGLYQAWGYGGQRIAVIPRLDMVIVFTGGINDNHGYPFARKLYEEFIIPSVKSDDALPENREACSRLKDWARRINAGPEPKGYRLPPAAGEVSGRTYRLDSNALDIRSMALSFDGTPEATVEIQSKMISGKFPVGLDGRYRMTAVKEFGRSLALRGSWKAGDTFALECLNVDFGYRYFLECCFAGDQIQVKSHAVIENVKETIQGRSGAAETPRRP